MAAMCRQLQNDAGAGCCDVPASTTLEGFDNLLRNLHVFVCPVARVTNALHVSPPTKPRPWQGASPLQHAAATSEASKTSLLPSLILFNSPVSLMR
jgi:hypothetical protein